MTANVPVDHVLIAAGLLFAIGVVGVLVRRNLVFVLMSLEMMLSAAVLAFAAAGARWGQADGQIMVLFILATAAAEISIGLPLLILIRNGFRSVDADRVSEMRG